MTVLTMRTRIETYSFVALLVVTAGAFAQYTGNSQIVTVDGVISNWTGTFYLGNSTWGDVLVVTNGGTLAVTNGEGRLGNIAGSSNNTAIVTGAGSLWTNSSSLSIGDNGANNQLVISAGGTVCNAAGTIGHTASSSNNSVWVTGSGSAWRNSGSIIAVGSIGSGNVLTITNRGSVYGINAQFGSNGGSNNTAVVTGAGSIWTNTSNLTVGQSSGGGNQLTIASSGAVYCAYAYVGYGSGGGNSVLVTETGSIWRCSNYIMGNASGAGNQLIVTNGGVLLNAGNMNLGNASSNNLIQVTGAGSVLSNSASGTYVYVGNSGMGNQVMISEGGVMYCKGDVTLGKSSGGTNNRVLVSGNGASLNVTGNLTANGGGNGLIMSNGGVALIKGTVTINADSYVTNYVSRYSSGLDMTGSTLTLGGGLNINFVGAPVATGLFWGLRWSGNHTNTLQGFKNAGLLVVNDSGLPAYLQGKASIIYDSINTYVGFVASNLVSGSVFLMR